MTGFYTKMDKLYGKAKKELGSWNKSFIDLLHEAEVIYHQDFFLHPRGPNSHIIFSQQHSLTLLYDKRSLTVEI
jgi:hypothetical protein